MSVSIANNFIKRPVLTTVCTLVILLLGCLCIPLLPLNYLPDIAPIRVQVSANYTGADVATVESAVTTTLERQINGVEGMQYMTSNSSAGSSQISVYFGAETDKNIAQVNVQNRIARATPRLPTSVQQLGVTAQTASTSILLVYTFYAENNEYDPLFISNYIDLNLRDQLLRTPGVGDLTIFGEKRYAMRLWLDPNALASRQLTVADVATALRSQNILAGAGTLGQAPIPPGQSYEIPLRVNGQFQNAAEFENLVIKAGSNGDLIKLRDVGRAELGSETYASNARNNGKPAIGLAIYQSPGSNALDVAKNIEAQMEELSKEFPPGLKTQVVYDTVGFVQASLEEVVKTLVEAIVLVVLVIFLFLQDWRATIIPLVAIPVSLVGALAFAYIFKFSLNNLTLFGLILATGLVVDDAIIVVEAIARKIEQGVRPLQASFEAMEELTGAVVATSLVLMAVFIPVAFFPGSTGKMYQQFALVIAFSIVISTFNALTFSPSMAAILLRPPQPKRGPLGWFFTKFNQVVAWIIDRFLAIVRFLIRLRYAVVALFVVGLFGTYFMFTQVPTGFVPNEDQGIVLGIIQGPDGVALNYTDEVITKLEQILQKEPEIENVFATSGFGFAGSGSNRGVFFAKLKPWEERTNPNQSASAILKRINGAFQTIPEAIITAVNPPPIQGFSTLGGFELQLEDRTNGRLTIDDFFANAQAVIAQANQQPSLAGGVFTQFTASTPQFQIDFDRNRLEALNVDFQQAVNTLGAAIGSQYVNDFTLGQQSYRVYVQAEGNYRRSPDDINQLYVRSANNQMVRLSEVAKLTPITGPSVISHYNGFRSISIQGREAQGYSSGQAIQAMQQTVTATALPGVGSDWTGTAREELSAGNLGILIFGFGIIMVFLTLAAQYESYVDPAIILLTVPLALFGALSALSLRGLVNDVYANVALVMLIGLASKNAILIVEFANQAFEQGMTITQAALTAAQERFRPIVMTSSASLLGFFPLVIASGAGSASRWSLGTALFGGLLVATVLSLLIVPVLYVIIKNLEERFLKRKPAHQTKSPNSDIQEEQVAAGVGSGDERGSGDSR
ncbi:MULTISPECIES: efflux RND transporter permease subunit [unclassified Tolypothrix]|uniref:efflux RND transporter permease subunit n=1 Tax=unclassified Tolypothrix TaxID=2649714 RepID=UPI0009DA9099|nr:efflux RND transporter permease subunit [Tolypothrix sp. PCC 7601]MBE9085059.1 efflux RND transporter permease subunit [Tolypothrix sp. LEGE 11397]UYD23840.1 efflux RND transporter permease subunit [Tolypothrix sp. PCC 7712]UYD33935.1 efflux RND transporter permease subunit [Tolypothrix sp. PCC 7601]